MVINIIGFARSKGAILGITSFDRSKGCHYGLIGE